MLLDYYFEKTKYPLEDHLRSRAVESPEDFIDCMTGSSSVESCYVFYNPDTKLFKIGMSGNWPTRFGTIRTTSGSKDLDVAIVLELEPGYDESSGWIESRLHDYFKEKRVVGEWFNLNKRDLVQIRLLFYKIGGLDLTDNLLAIVKKMK
jgi:hypothetical protein